MAMVWNPYVTFKDSILIAADMGVVNWSGPSEIESV
ncbi:hypothetical protein COLO4_14098 [Corchorus olitorius]|uniref:Uncharacterized protein n=1 Tax=Corchorus olitorius TaxID=93759 RepID=A0A1R3JTF7_9ROSI|nr:hypothetical protein COLO4_14098 [Corchorus olitorius]